MNLEFSPEEIAFRDEVRTFIAENYPVELRGKQDEGDELSKEDFLSWHKVLAKKGWVAPAWPVEYGGTGWTPTQRYLFDLERAAANAPVGLSMGVIMLGPVLMAFGTEAQKARYLPRIRRCEDWWCQGYSEPGAGSDLASLKTSAVADGDDYVINGSKTFISNGQHCDLVIVVCRTSDAPGAKGISLLLVDTTSPGFRRGRNLDKLGHLSSDTSELFFDEVRVPVENLLGAEGTGFASLMNELPQERLTLAVSSMGAAQKAYDITVDYVRNRKAFGKTVLDFQNTRYKLADLKAELSVGWAFVDQCLDKHDRHALTSADASIAKLWCTEMHGRLVDTCLQFFGGYGFMREYEICKLYADARVQRIYGGTSEIMRELISRSL